MDFNLDCNVAFRRLSSKLSMSYLGFLLLVISCFIYFFCFIEQTSVFHQKGGLGISKNQSMKIVYEKLSQPYEKAVEKTATDILKQQKQILEKTLGECRQEMNNTTNSLLEMETDIQRRINETSFEMAKLFEQEMRKDKNRTDNYILKLVQMFNEERVILEAKLAIKREFFDYAASSLRGTSYPGVENYIRYAVTRLEILPMPLAVVKPLIPEFGPVINKFTEIRYPIAIPSCPRDSATSANRRSVFIAVISAPGNVNKRSAIRQTWTNHIQTVLDKGLLTMVRYAFILGKPGNDLTQTQIEEESKNFGDIIQIEMSDYYRNLPLKVAGLLNWLDKNCANVDFVFKVDDDVYVNMHNLAHFVQSHHEYNRSVFGIGYPNGNIPDRDGKWSITYEEWPWNQYPHYLLGGAVLIHGSSIFPLLAASQTIPMIPFDDLYFFGMCTEKAVIKTYFSSGSTSVFNNDPPDVSTACELRALIARLVHEYDDVKFGEIMNLSHGIADKFYSNGTQCTLTDPNGLVSNFDNSELVEFNFNHITTLYKTENDKYFC